MGLDSDSMVEPAELVSVLLVEFMATIAIRASAAPAAPTAGLTTATVTAIAAADFCSGLHRFRCRHFGYFTECGRRHKEAWASD